VVQKIYGVGMVRFSFGESLPSVIIDKLPIRHVPVEACPKGSDILQVKGEPNNHED
jgi:hypothetical protein